MEDRIGQARNCFAYPQNIGELCGFFLLLFNDRFFFLRNVYDIRSILVGNYPFGYAQVLSSLPLRRTTAIAVPPPASDIRKVRLVKVLMAPLRF